MLNATNTVIDHIHDIYSEIIYTLGDCVGKCTAAARAGYRAEIVRELHKRYMKVTPDYLKIPGASERLSC